MIDPRETAESCLSLVERLAPHLMRTGGGPLIDSNCCRRPRPLKPVPVDRIRRMHKHGMSDIRIAEKLHLTRSAVRRALGATR